MIKSRSFRDQGREYHLQAEAVSIGDDLCVAISGGDRPHIGAAALGAWTASVNHPDKWTTTSSLITAPGHKEGQLALMAAEQLSKNLERTVVVLVGVHIEGITPDLISRVEEEYRCLVDDLEMALLAG